MDTKLALATILVLLYSVANANIVYDGNINEPEWGIPLSTSAGGPSPGFGAGHEVNAVYVFGDAVNINFAIAGNVQNGNRILVFIDSKAGGYTNGSFNRSNAPQGIDDFNSGTTFDIGFEPDYSLVIGTNTGNADYFFDLFTLSPTGSNNFLGSSNATPEIGASPVNSNNSRGFEIAIDKADLGYTSGDIDIMVMYISDGGFLSNQFLTPAGSSESDYGGGAVTFSAAAPGQITVASSILPVTLTHLTSRARPGSTALEWRTATELNNDYFEVQRSAGLRHWAVIGQVKGRGTTQEPQRYAFTDRAPLPGRSYYRLRQVDYDGQHEFHGPVAAEQEKTGTPTAFPNPVADRLYLRPSPLPGSRLLLFNAAGQEVASWAGEAYSSGLSLPALPPGAYVLKYQVEGQQGQPAVQPVFKQ